jgi:serine/threonine-protein kinase
LYALLVGQPPFVAASPREVRAQIREDKLVKLSKYQPGIPAVFEAAVLKLLARRPEDGFQTAAEMLAVVEPIALEHDIKL